jgi:hypothetical protein
MVNELEFDSNDNLYPLYQSDPEAYRGLLQKHGIQLHPELIEKARKTTAVHQQPAYPPAKNDVSVVAGGEE